MLKTYNDEGVAEILPFFSSAETWVRWTSSSKAHPETAQAEICTTQIKDRLLSVK